MQIVALAFKEGVLFDVQDDIQVAGRTGERARFAEAAETNSRAILHSGGHFRFNHALAHEAAFAFALGTGIGDYRARSLTRGAGARDAEEALLISDLAPAVARPAADRSFTGRGAGAAASIASLMAADIHLLIDAEYRLIKFEMQVFAKIGSALGPAATAAALSKHVAEAKNIAKDVAEILKDGGIESSRTASTAHAGVPEAVIQSPFVAIGKNGVRLGDLLELIFRFRIVRISIGMVRHRKLAISALDFNVGGYAGYTQHLVIIAFCVGGQKLSQSFVKPSCQLSVVSSQFNHNLYGFY